MLFQRLVLASILLFAACSSDNVSMIAGDSGTPDLGSNARDAAPRPDMGVAVPDSGAPDTGEPDTGVRDAGTPPPSVVRVSGQLRELSDFLAGTTTTAGVGAATILAYGVSPLASTVTQEGANAGNYALDVPANGQIIFYSTKVGYNTTYSTVTTQAVTVTGKQLYVASNTWVNAIAAAYNVDLGMPFPCHAPSLNPQQSCIYAAVVGRIDDDGTAGMGVLRPVEGILANDLTFAVGPNADRMWFKEGPFFLGHTGTASVGATATIVVNDNGNYRGGLFITFFEIPQTDGPESLSVNISVRHDYGGGNFRYFGPIDVSVFRPYGVAWTTVPETGVPPPTPNTNIDFDSQIYPLFLPITQGGLGCQGCHTNANGATPTGGMNLFGGPDVAFESLNPAMYPLRVNLASPSDSLLLKRPLYEAQGPQDHPIFAFASERDPAYQLILTWIQEGAMRRVVLQPVSFANDIQPLLANPVAMGGRGCHNCHVLGVDALTAPGGFYLGGTTLELHNELTNEAPSDNGLTLEPFRVNEMGLIEKSLVLTNPLMGSGEPHPVKIFSSNVDPMYQLLYRWISEGYRNN